MRFSIFFGSVALTLACGMSSMAQASELGMERARANVCLSCHQVDKKRVGPSFKAIGERYREVEGVINYLVITIREGGAGRWGAVPMPAQPQVSQADALLIAQWILDLGEAQDN